MQELECITFLKHKKNNKTKQINNNNNNNNSDPKERMNE